MMTLSFKVIQTIGHISNRHYAFAIMSGAGVLLWMIFLAAALDVILRPFIRNFI